MAFLYIDKQIGTIGEASQLLLVGVENTEAILNGLSDSEITSFAEDVAEDSTGITLTDAVALLREVAEEQGDWKAYAGLRHPVPLRVAHRHLRFSWGNV